MVPDLLHPHICHLIVTYDVTPVQDSDENPLYPCRTLYSPGGGCYNGRAAPSATVCARASKASSLSSDWEPGRSGVTYGIAEEGWGRGMYTDWQAFAFPQ